MYLLYWDNELSDIYHRNGIIYNMQNSSFINQTILDVKQSSNLPNKEGKTRGSSA